MLVGRDAERARIESLLAEARDGRSGALVLRGEPGIGKTTLCELAAEQAAGMTVLRARGLDSESDLAFAGLADLLRPVLDRLDAIPEPQAAALAGALAVGPPTARDRFTICAATLSLLAAASEDAPLLAVVDDAHWLDTSSVEALLFAARRLGAEGTAMLFAFRSGDADGLAPTGLPEVELHGLDAEAAHALLEESARRPVARDVATRLAAVTGGNPLALVELAGTLGEAELAGKAPLPATLVSGRNVERPFVRRATELPESAQRALVVAAAAESVSRSTLVRALERLGLDPGELDLLESRGLLVVEAGRVKFRHPLFRSWAYHGATGIERRAAHQALAEVSGRRESPDRRAWHLAFAASSPDEDVAATLERTARDAHRRGAPAEAASAFERAARLTADDELRARRLREAANHFRLAGRPERAVELLDEALALAPTDALRADIQHVRGRVEMWRGAGSASHDLLVAEAERIAAHDPPKAAVMLTDAVMLAIARGDIRAAGETARKACVAGERAGGVLESLSKVALETVQILRGEAQTGRPLAALADASIAAADPELPAHQLILFAGSALVWVEEYEKARQLLTGIAERARAASAPGELPLVLATLSDLDYRTGRWPAAYASATEAMRLAVDTRQTGVLPFALTCAARLEAAQGREDECRHHTTRALELAESVGAGSTPFFAHSALGLLALGLGRPDEAIAELERTAAAFEAEGLGEPAVVHWGADLIEAYVRAGRPDAAEEAVTAFEALATRTGRAWALAASSRCRGLLVPEDALEATFATALEWHERTPTPFERARTELCFGERLRRARRRADAREWLRRAAETFEALGAVAWMDRARTELYATGETIRRREGMLPIQGLTPQELQIALLVGEGATNREIGAALFLSPKTVETHLSRVYRKLSVRSRTELAGLLASEQLAVGAA